MMTRLLLVAAVLVAAGVGCGGVTLSQSRRIETVTR